MGSNESSQKKISTQELFGDILSEVESAWEKRTRASSGSAGATELEAEATAGVARPVGASVADVQAATGHEPQPEPPIAQSSRPVPAQAPASEQETAALPAPSDADPPQDNEPTAELFSPPDTGRELPQNGHTPGASVAATPAVDPDPAEDPDVDAAEAEPPVAVTPAEPSLVPPPAESMESQEPAQGPSPAAAAAATAETSESTLDLPSLQLQPAQEAPTEDSLDALAADEHAESDSYMPWMEERGSTNWGRLGAMAGVAAVIGLGIWWFALRPAPSAEDSSAPTPVFEPADSFIAGIEEQVVAEEAAIEVQDQVTAVVETPSAAEPQAEPAAEQTGPATQPAASGPTTAELEAMIASRLADQERRLRAQLDEQRQALESEIARIEAANAGSSVAAGTETEAQTGADPGAADSDIAGQAGTTDATAGAQAADGAGDQPAAETSAADESAGDEGTGDTATEPADDAAAETAGDQG